MFTKKNPYASGHRWKKITETGGEIEKSLSFVTVGKSNQIKSKADGDIKENFQYSAKTNSHPEKNPKSSIVWLHSKERFDLISRVHATL